MAVYKSLLIVFVIILFFMWLSGFEYSAKANSKRAAKRTLEQRRSWESYNASYQHYSRSGCSYVGFGNRMKANRQLHGIGNRLFYYSAMMYVAWLTDRRPCVFTKSNFILDKVFDVHIPRVNNKKNVCPLYTFRQRGIALYDTRVKSLVNISRNISILLDGYFQSWMYTEPIATQLRQQLRFKKSLTAFVADFLLKNTPRGWSTKTFVRVGVHVRRGNFLRKGRTSTGFAVANTQYLQRAMRHFVEHFPKVQFIVASDDIQWCRKHVKLPMFNKSNAIITFSTKHNAAEDLALLASCNHTVMTTGTYSWWAAWLANGITVYYADYPTHGSALSKFFDYKEYYRPDWIGIDNVT